MIIYFIEIKYIMYYEYKNYFICHYYMPYSKFNSIVLKYGNISMRLLWYTYTWIDINFVNEKIIFYFMHNADWIKEEFFKINFTY